MEAPNEASVELKEISQKIFKDYEEHGRNIKQLRINSSVIPLSEFYDGLKNEFEEINRNTTPCNPTIEDFADFFKQLENNPANIEKPKQNAKDMQRSFLQQQTSIPSKHVSSVETYKEFKVFQKKLNQLLEKLEQKQISKEYEQQLNQLSTFARQLENLLPSGNNEQAFSAEEESKLRGFVENMERLNFIKQNQDEMFQTFSQQTSPAIIDVLSHALKAISVYNVN